jgi:hypothetical protein
MMFSSLRTLPKGFENLISLTELCLRNISSMITNCEGLGSLTSLAKLNLPNYQSLTTVSKGLGIHLCSIKCIDVYFQELFKGYILRDRGVHWKILELSIIAPI